MDVKNILSTIKSARGSYIGIRSLTPDEQYSVGDYARQSYEWDADSDCSAYYTTGETAGGTCCVLAHTCNYSLDDPDDAEAVEAEIIRAIDKASGVYGSGRLAVLVADRDVSRDYAVDDEDEGRLVDAVVVALIA